MTLKLTEHFFVLTLREFDHLLISKGFENKDLTTGIKDDGDSISYVNGKLKIEISLRLASLLKMNIYIQVNDKVVLDAMSLDYVEVKTKGVTSDNIQQTISMLRKKFESLNCIETTKVPL